MAAFNFNFYGYDYEHGIDVLRDSLLEATEALNAKEKSTQKTWEEYEDKVASGEIAEIAEYDDETGSLIYNQSQVYEHDVEVVREAIQAVRKAHVISLYHLWERIVRQWTGTRQNARHEKLVNRVRAKGIEPPERFEHIYRLNNVLKHNSEDSGPKLLVAWPELFWNSAKLKTCVDNGGAQICWESNIILSDKTMEEVVTVMKASGPLTHITDRNPSR